MISKTLIGWMLVLGPIAAIIFIFLTPGLESDDFSDRYPSIKIN